MVLLLLAGVAALVIRSEAAVKSYQQTESDARDRGLNPIEFRFDHSRKLELSKPPGAYVRAERRRDGELVAQHDGVAVPDGAPRRASSPATCRSSPPTCSATRRDGTTTSASSSRAARA